MQQHLLDRDANLDGPLLTTEPVLARLYERDVRQQLKDLRASPRLQDFCVNSLEVLKNMQTFVKLSNVKDLQEPFLDKLDAISSDCKHLRLTPQFAKKDLLSHERGFIADKKVSVRMDHFEGSPKLYPWFLLDLDRVEPKHDELKDFPPMVRHFLVKTKWFVERSDGQACGFSEDRRAQVPLPLHIGVAGETVSQVKVY